MYSKQENELTLTYKQILLVAVIVVAGSVGSLFLTVVLC